MMVTANVRGKVGCGKWLFLNLGAVGDHLVLGDRGLYLVR